MIKMIRMWVNVMRRGRVETRVKARVKASVKATVQARLIDTQNRWNYKSRLRVGLP